MAMTNIATATPMPAFAPVDRPELLEDDALAGDEAGGLRAVVVLLSGDVLIGDDDAAVEVGGTAVTENATSLICPTAKQSSPHSCCLRPC